MKIIIRIMIEKIQLRKTELSKIISNELTIKRVILINHSTI